LGLEKGQILARTGAGLQYIPICHTPLALLRLVSSSYSRDARSYFKAGAGITHNLEDQSIDGYTESLRHCCLWFSHTTILVAHIWGSVFEPIHDRALNTGTHAWLVR